MNVAVITGASSGMGREFVYAIDKDMELDELWVIARREDRLLELQDKVRSKIRPVVLDLLDRDSLRVFAELLDKEKPCVKVLVNAAGFGLFGTYTEMDMEKQLQIIDLNDRALTGMTYITLPYMPDCAQIYNMGSMSSFQPVPYINVYGASKAYVLSFSKALRVELCERKIKVMAVCPGWIKTEFFSHAIHDDTVNYFNRYYTAEQVVEKAVKDLKKGKDVSVLGFDDLPLAQRVRPQLTTIHQPLKAIVARSVEFLDRSEIGGVGASVVVPFEITERQSCCALK